METAPWRDVPVRRPLFMRAGCWTTGQRWYKFSGCGGVHRSMQVYDVHLLIAVAWRHDRILRCNGVNVQKTGSSWDWSCG